jgi:hypothetical protein
MPNFKSPFTNTLNGTIPELVNASALKRGSWVPQGNAVTIDTQGMLAPTAVGTATARNWANTSLLTRTKRVGYVSGATAGNMTEAYAAGLQFAGGNSRDGGVIFQAIIAITDAATVAGARSFFGLAGTASALTNAEPTALTNCIGFAQIAADTNMRVIWNDGSGTASSIDLGANFPMTAGNMYEFGIIWQPGASTVEWSVYKITGDTDGVAENTYFQTGVITNGDLPALTQGLAPHLWRTNNATALATAFDLAVCNVASYL